MTYSLDELLTELENFGKATDASNLDRAGRMLNITRDTGEFLAVLVTAINAKNILEIGTSNGYSTIWLANAASRIGGSVQTVENSTFKINLAKANFERAGLQAYIRQIKDDAGNSLAEFSESQFDLVFLDSERSEYTRWWTNIRRTLRPGGLLVVDNATSHADEMKSFMAAVSQDIDFVTSLVPLGNGEFLAAKLSQ